LGGPLRWRARFQSENEELAERNTKEETAFHERCQMPFRGIRTLRGDEKSNRGFHAKRAPRPVRGRAVVDTPPVLVFVGFVGLSTHEAR
jgi:hypothetical protein